MAQEIDHWANLAAFGRAEILAGGPDPHMRCVGYLIDGLTLEERRWRCGVYVGVYNVPGAEAIWHAWPWEAAAEGQPQMAAWIAEHWAGLPFRRERRAARTPVKLAAYFATLAAFLREDFAGALCQPPGPLRYEDLWESSDMIKYAGRYAKFKLLEAWSRYAETGAATPDIRAPGGDSPRAVLGWLYPEAATAIKHDDAAAEAYAGRARSTLAEEYGLDLDWYTLEVFLCDYRQSYEGKRQYPGRSNDSELGYVEKARAYWGESVPFGMYRARRAVLNPLALGELQGWTAVRENLGPLLHGTGRTWSDICYDYQRTSNPAWPVLRGAGTPGAWSPEAVFGATGPVIRAWSR